MFGAPVGWVPVHRFMKTEAKPVKHWQIVSLFHLGFIATALCQRSNSRFLYEAFCPAVFLLLPVAFGLVHGLSYLAPNVSMSDHFSLDPGDCSRVELKVSARLSDIEAANDAS